MDRQTGIGVWTATILVVLMMLTGCATEESESSGVQVEPPVSVEAPVQERDMTMNILIGERRLTATLVENSSTRALMELLAEAPVTIDMQDYGSMEKVGELGRNLPTNDERITTEPGDLILYQGNTFSIYYAPNTWSLTRLGSIDDVSRVELIEALGSGEVTVVLSRD